MLDHLADAEGRPRARDLPVRRARHRQDPVAGRSHPSRRSPVAGRARTVRSLPFEGAGTLPFQPFAEAVETYLDGTASPFCGPWNSSCAANTPRRDRRCSSDERRSSLLDCDGPLPRRLCCADAPVAVVVDDLHWADDGTIAMLRHVARSTPLGHRLLLVGAYRGGDVTDAHPLADALGALRSEAECSVVRLAGLDRGAIRRLVDVTAGAPVAAEAVDAVAAESRGQESRPSPGRSSPAPARGRNVGFPSDLDGTSGRAWLPSFSRPFRKGSAR